MVGILLQSLVIALSINIILFLVAYRYRSDKLTDISYAISFMALDIFALFHAKKINTYSLILFLLVAIWSLRIGGFLLIRILRVGKDKRFDDLRNNFIKFGKFWIGQAFTSWVLMLPLTLALYNGGIIGFAAILGAVLWFGGLTIEAIADYQKFAFKQTYTSKNVWIQSGVWRYSRHPNYFGEILVWVGIYIYCFTSLTLVEKVLGLSSPGLITAVLLLVSGVPILEKAADQRWGDVAAYKLYKRNSRLLVPIPKFYRKT